MSHTIQQPRFQIFDKYEFVKSYVAIAHLKDSKAKDQREEEAALIANAIKDNQNLLLENLATKEDIKNLEEDIKTLELTNKADLKTLEYRMIIKLTVIMATLLTLLPLATNFIRSIFQF